MTKQPLVIGVGGLLEQGDKGGRINIMLQSLKERGCRFYAPSFGEISRDGNTILCPINGKWVKDIDSAVREALKDDLVDPDRMGFIASSLGATYVDKFLVSADYLTKNKIPYAAIVPFAKVHPDRVRDLQKMIEAKIDLDVSFPWDTEKGNKRVIPHDYLQNVLEIDIPNTLETAGKKLSTTPLTILGEKDNRVDNEAAIRRHILLGGSTETLDLIPEYGHSIPQEKIQEKVLNFMCTELGINL